MPKERGKKMKEILIIISILLIIVISSICTYRFLDNSSKPLVKKLDDLKAKIEDSGSKEELEKDASTIYSEWESVNIKWSNLVLHTEIDSIETALIRAKSRIEIDKADESLEDIDTAIFLINHIKEKEKTNLKNIF